MIGAAIGYALWPARFALAAWRGFNGWKCAVRADLAALAAMDNQSLDDLLEARGYDRDRPSN